MNFSKKLPALAGVIALASGAIAFLALLPGIAGGPQSASSRVTADELARLWQHVVFSVFAGMAIRLTGTVALFLTCRYHMASPAEMIATITIAWYIALTLIEVTVLVWEQPKSQPKSLSPSTSAAEKHLPAKA